MYKDKLTKSVADAVRQVTEHREPQVLNEELKGNQHKIDANKNGKIDAEDFKKLRKEETIEEKKYEPAEPDADAIAKKRAREEAQRRREERAERDADDLSKDYKPKTQSSGVKKVAGKAYGGAAQKSDVDESVQIDETPVTKAKAPYRPGSIDPATGKTREAPKGTMAYDAAQRKKLKESFSSLIESYVDGGIKSLFENLQVVEEQASEEEFNAELKKQKDKAEGKAPQADVAAAATQGTKSMKEDVHNEIQVVDLTDPDNIHTETIDLEERTLTAGETTEKERIVKGMKKGIEGFKQRYGDRAKEVLYATATKQAKKD